MRELDIQFSDFEPYAGSKFFNLEISAPEIRNSFIHLCDKKQIWSTIEITSEYPAWPLFITYVQQNVMDSRDEENCGIYVIVRHVSVYCPTLFEPSIKDNFIIVYGRYRGNIAVDVFDVIFYAVHCTIATSVDKVFCYVENELCFKNASKEIYKFFQKQGTV